MKRLQSLYVTGTYTGCLEGHPPSASVIRGAKGNAERMWGRRPVVVLDPVRTDRDVLPRWENLAWLDGPAKDRENDGSYLILLWYSDEPGSAESALRLVERVDWAEMAEDYQW